MKQVCKPVALSRFMEKSPPAGRRLDRGFAGSNWFGFRVFSVFRDFNCRFRGGSLSAGSTQPLGIASNMRMNLAVLNRLFLALAITAWAAGASSVARAEVKPNGLFSEGAVLQRGVTVPVWGAAKDGERVTVKVAEQSVTTPAKDGRWLVRLKLNQEGLPATPFRTDIK